MKTYQYHQEFQILITQVLKALGELVIKRVDENTNQVVDSIAVTLKYAPKGRIIHDLTNTNHHIMLPVMALFNTGIQYDVNRAFNKLEGSLSYINETSSHFANTPQPLPINLNLSLSIVGRYQSDIDQIVTNLFVNFYPYIIISYRHPTIQQEVRCKVMWDGNVSLKTPLDINPQTPYRIEGDTTFKVEGWIFKNAGSPVGKIFNVDMSFTSVSSVNNDYDYFQSLENEYNTEYVYISGRPHLKLIDDSTEYLGSSGSTYELYGSMFTWLCGMYLSASPDVYPTSAYTYIDSFSGTNLSSTYLPMSAISISSFNVVSDNYVTFTIPAPIAAGYIDVFAWSEAGRGQLTIDSIRPYTNPYPSSLPEYSTYVEYQPACVSGIKVI